jgi:predicted esterase
MRDPCNDQKRHRATSGGAMSLLMLRSAHTFAGILAMSGFLPLRHDSVPIVSPENALTPILMQHGDADPTVWFLVQSLVNT